MKKILTILGAITLTASTSLSVLACGSTKTPPISPTDENIRDFKTELNNIWNTVYNQNADKFVRKVEANSDNENYQLFNYDYLNDNYGAKGNETFDLFKNKNAQEMFIEDLNILFASQEFTNLIQTNIATGKDAIKYRNLYMGSPAATLGAFKISETDKFDLQRTEYTNVNTSTKELMYSISVTVTKDMYYKNAQGMTEVYKTNKIPLKLLIGKDGQVLTFIEKVASELPKQMINNGNANFSSSKIKSMLDDFKTYTGSFDLSLHALINNDEYKNLLSQDIEKINNREIKYQISYGDTIADHSNIKVVSEMIQNNTETKQQLETKTLYDLQRNPLANSLILKKTETEVLEEKHTLPMLEEVVGNVNEAITTHEEALESFLNSYSISYELKKFLIETSYSFGYFRLQSIYIELDKNTKLELPTIVIPWTYQNDDNQLEKKSAWLKSIYEGLKVVNNNVMRANSKLVTSSSQNNSRGIYGNIFSLSDAVVKNLKDSFLFSWNNLVTTPLPTSKWSWETKKQQSAFDKIWNHDTTTGIVTLDLVGNAKSNNTDNVVVKDMLYDFDSFSAKIEGIQGYDKRENTLTSTDTSRTGDGLDAYKLTTYRDIYGTIGGMDKYNQTSSIIVPEVSPWAGENLVPSINNYKFSLGWINFSLFLPLDDGEWLDNFVENSDQTWRGEQYFELSNDRSLFADSTNDKHFNWNLQNPYKFDKFITEPDTGFYQLANKPLFWFPNS